MIFQNFVFKANEKNMENEKNREIFFDTFFIMSENPKSGVVFPDRMREVHYYKHFRNSFSRFSTIFLQDLLIRIRGGKSLLDGNLL